MPDTLIILTPGFPKDEADSTCLPDRQIFVRVLKETYPDLHIVVLSFQYPYQPKRYSWHGVQVTALGGKNKSGLQRRITWAGAWYELKKLNKKNHVVGLLSFWLDECAYIGDKFAKKHQLKHYSWLLGQDARAGNRYVNRIKPKGENLIALSDFLVNEFERNYLIVPQHVVPGAIDAATFKPSSAKRNIDVLGAGSLISLKQFNVFVDNINCLKSDHPEIKAVICGKGAETDALQTQIKQLGLENNITLMGQLPHEQVLELMQRTRVFMHTSNYEGFGIVCLEALHAGAKVVSFAQPMQIVIENWHIVKTADEMQQIANTILNDKDAVYESVLPYQTADAAKAVIQLFAE
ncbi:MAG TPA: glycosyltransferase family 4 protein [Mucilaginibacter sp.]|jgi:glycosyltransferase involved in cell wall biosynthesis|nr:glycosyltransferase family 4 protein [Mucilaginibacter sp.]